MSTESEYKNTGIQCYFAPGNIVLNEVLFIAESLGTGKGFLNSFAYLMHFYKSQFPAEKKLQEYRLQLSTSALFWFAGNTAFVVHL